MESRKTLEKKFLKAFPLDFLKGACTALLAGYEQAARDFGKMNLDSCDEVYGTPVVRRCVVETQVRAFAKKYDKGRFNVTVERVPENNMPYTLIVAGEFHMTVSRSSTSASCRGSRTSERSSRKQTRLCV